jgi:hypothetical protein
MGKCVWIVHQYASPETGMGDCQFYLASELAKQGHKVYLIASGAYYLLRNKVEVSGGYKFEIVDGFNMVWVNMPQYDQANSKQRALNWFIFPWRIQKLASLMSDKSDAVLFPISYLFFGG